MAVDPIINDLRYVHETGQELDILNFYKSFPITCKARVESIDRDGVVLKVEPPGSIVLEAQEETIILSLGLPEAVKARVGAFDLLNGTLRLQSLNYVGPRFGERMIVRVQPDDPIEVELETGRQRIAGQLVDVSLSGVGVYIHDHIPEHGQVLQLTLPLPAGRVTLPGKVLNISDAPGGGTRLSIGFTRNAQEIAVIMRYIKDRRIEILAEIEQMYERAYHEKQSQKSEETVE